MHLPPFQFYLLPCASLLLPTLACNKACWHLERHHTILEVENTLGLFLFLNYGATVWQHYNVGGGAEFKKKKEKSGNYTFSF